MADALREMRTQLNLPAKDMVSVVQQLYPKYDKTMQSKCENGDAYGITLRKDAMRALQARFDPSGKWARRYTGERHRLKCRISARLENDDYDRLQRKITANGYHTVQDWLTQTVKEYIEGDEAGNV